MKVQIRYCIRWGYRPEALRVRDALQRKGIAEIDLQEGTSGQFDVLVDGTLKYSRHRTGRFPSETDIDALV